jgi:single-stranded DNA-binding protein
MADKNVVTVQGNLTRDAVYIEKEGHTPVSLLHIACNRCRRNPATGDWERYARFFDVRVYGPLATQASTYAKGEKVLVKEEGYLDSYTKERRGYITIVAAKAADGITRVPKAEEQSQASTGSDEASVS